MSTRALVTAPVLMVALATCGGEPPGVPIADESPLQPAGEPPPRGKSNPPSLARRLDRVGRPQIVATLIAAFEADTETRAEAVRSYHSGALGDTRFRSAFEARLALIDSIDNVCGNQLWPDPSVLPRYRSLATLLLDDQIYVHGERVGGSVYLGLEAEAAGALQGTRAGAAGGRLPGFDAIQSTYSALISGVLSGVDDGITSDDAAHDPTSFPFLAPPDPQ
jgi:hypothetical protein